MTEMSQKMLYRYRVTKYDPRNREDGRYLLDEWTCFAQIGESFDGKTLTELEYYWAEDTYVSVGLSFLRESRISDLAIVYLENSRKHKEPGLRIRRGRAYAVDELERLFRLVLRETFWAKFEGYGGTYVHFGWDYYMYLGVPVECRKSIAYATERGLFVEPFKSPHL